MLERKHTPMQPAEFPRAWSSAVQGKPSQLLQQKRGVRLDLGEVRMFLLHSSRMVPRQSATQESVNPPGWSSASQLGSTAKFMEAPADFCRSKKTARVADSSAILASSSKSADSREFLNNAASADDAMPSCISVKTGNAGHASGTLGLRISSKSWTGRRLQKEEQT